MASFSLRSNKAIDGDSLRSVHDELCDVLGVSEETMLSFTAGLYSKKVITRNEKKGVLDKCGSKGADTLLDLVGMKIEMGYKRLDTVLVLLEGEENLKHFVDKIKDKQKVLSEENNMETGSSSSESNELMEDDLDIIHSKAKKLVEEFDELVVLIHAKISTINTGQLIVRLDLYIGREVNDVSTQGLFDDLDSVVEPGKVLTYLILQKCIGYLNYDLLKIFHKSIENDVEVESMLSRYEANVMTFLKLTSLSTIADLFQQHSEFAPHSLVGLPKFTVTLNTEWEGKSVYQWKELLDKQFNWSPHVHVTKITRNCVIIEYSVLPFFAPAVVRDLTDPLVLAVLKRQGVTVELSQELIDSTQPDEHGYTSLHLAAESGKTDTVETLVKLGATIHKKSTSGCTPLHFAAKSGRTETVETLVILGDNIHEEDWNGYTPLHLAAKSGNTDTVEMLFKLGADIHKEDNYGYTPLHLAAGSGKTDTVETLVKLGADISKESESGSTPLHLAAESGKTDTVKTLNKLGADIFKKDKRGYTPLHLAAMSGKTDTVETLVKLGADVYNRDRFGYTPLHLAAVSGETDTVEKLVRLGADIHKKDMSGYTPLHLAAESGKTDTVETLIELGASIHKEDEFGCTPLHLAAMSGKADTVKALLKLGANINKEDESGSTPLHFAAESGKTDTVETLVKLGADIHKEDERGYTPLHLAAKFGTTDTVETLVKLGADIYTEDKSGCTPLDLAPAEWSGSVETLVGLGANIL